MTIAEKSMTAAELEAAISQASNKKQEIKAQENEIERNKTAKRYVRKAQEHEPLIEQAKAVLRKINEEINEEFHVREIHVHTALTDVGAELNALRIEFARRFPVWYPEGTVVQRWEYDSSYRSKADYIKTEKTGIVCVYDGTQVIAENTAYNERPSIGDIIVIEHKKDGTLSKKCHLILIKNSYKLTYSLYGGYLWCIAGETPSNSLMRRTVEETERQRNALDDDES